MLQPAGTRDIDRRCHKIRFDRPCDRISPTGLQKERSAQVIVSATVIGTLAVLGTVSVVSGLAERK